MYNLKNCYNIFSYAFNGLIKAKCMEFKNYQMVLFMSRITLVLLKHSCTAFYIFRKIEIKQKQLGTIVLFTRLCFDLQP